METSVYSVLTDMCKIPKKIKIMDYNYCTLGEHEIYEVWYHHGDLTLYVRGGKQIDIPSGYYAEIDGNSITMKPDPDYYDIRDCDEDDIESLKIYKLELMDDEKYKKLIESIPGTIKEIKIDIDSKEIKIKYEIVEIHKLR